MPSHLVRAIAPLLALCLLPSEGMAASSYENCSGFIDSVPATITTQGVWCLRADLSTALSGGVAILAATNNVTIDCNDFKVGGLAAGPGTNAAGIAAIGRQNTVVRNCNIRGFRIGLAFQGGSGNVVEDSRFDGNTSMGILLEDTSSAVVRRNLVFNTGGAMSGYYGIRSIIASWADISDNVVTGLASPPANASAHGITASTNSSVRNNRIRGFGPTTENTVALGIAISGPGVAVEGNHVNGPATGPGIGISCPNNTSSAVRNILHGLTIGISNCALLHNVVNEN